MGLDLRPTLRIARTLAGCGWTLARAATSRRPSAHLHPFSRRTLRALGIRVELQGPIPPGGQLWVANHLSWLDPLVLLSLRDAGVLAKSEVADYPVIGGGTRRMGLAFVRREDPASRAGAVARVASELRKGRPFILFPEGTTTRGEGLAPLSEGGLRAAFRLGVSVLPWRLDSPDAHYAWTGDASLLPHLATLARLGRTRVDLRAGPILSPSDFVSEAAFLAAVRHHLAPTTPPSLEPTA